MNTSLPCILTGCMFYAFGVKWCYEYAKYWVSLRPRDNQGTSKGLRISERLEKLLNNHPIEGCLKLIFTAIGLIGTLAGGMTEVDAVSPKVVLATIYLFFAFSGLADVLNFYFPHNVSEGMVKLALAQGFFVEGFLFVWCSVGNDLMINTVLALIVWTTSLTVAMEILWPEMKLLRGCSTLLHGGWIAHMIRLHYTMPMQAQGIALVFSWHIAAASAVTLCIVAATRSCAPRLIVDEPPEVPIYDYCQEPDQRI